MILQGLRALGWRVKRRPLPVFFDEAYRLPLSRMAAPQEVDTRRASDALWYLLRSGAISRSDLRQPVPATYEELARAHDDEYLESLSRPETLASIFAVDPSEVVVDELLRTVRLATGGTLAAAKEALERKGPTLNLFGGFHHAAPKRGAGFCAVNDIAVAIASLRAGGFQGGVAVIDLDAHPPDGTAECLAADSNVWVASLSSIDWGPLPKVHQVHVSERASDGPYLAALEGLLSQVPASELAFVVAGGDVLAGDPLGLLGLSLDGARRRDLTVAQALEGRASVWLPGGGYTRGAWRVLAGTALALAARTRLAIPRSYDPLRARFSHIAQGLSPESLGSEPLLTEEDVAEALGVRSKARPRLLGFYTSEGLEFAFYRYGILPHLHRLGYDRLHVELDEVSGGGRVRVMGFSDGKDQVLMEAVLEKKQLAGSTVLFVNWLSLRNPRARFSDKRPQLPGQEVPGLGLARETAELLGLMARRLVLDGVAFRPAWFHIAYAGRYRARFVDPARQGRFEALMRDLKHLSLLKATTAVAQGRVRLDGKPYQWEADDMVYWLSRDEKQAEAEIAAERERAHFTVEA